MSSRDFVAWCFCAVVTLGCGPERADSSASTGSTTGVNTSSTSSTPGVSSTDSGVDSSGSSSSETGNGLASSSGSDSGGAATCDEHWTSPLPPFPWSYQDCLTDACPEGEVCRYDPHQPCGAHPVCVNPTTLACNCELYGPTAGGLACPCPDYDGPLNEFGQVVLECNTAMSPGPVQSNETGHCIAG